MLLLLTTAGSWAQEVHLVKRGNSTLLTADLAAKTAAGDLYVALQQHVVDKVGNQNVTYERYISGTGAMKPDFDYAGGTTTWKVIARDGGYVLQNSTGSYLKNNGSNAAITTANPAEATVYVVSDWGGNSASMLVSGYNQNQALNWEVKNQNPKLRINTNSSPIIHNGGTGGYTKIFTYEVEKKTIVPISFDPNITYSEGRTTDGSRYLNSIALQSSGRTQTISAGFTNLISSKQYLNLTDQHFTVGTGVTVQPIIDWKGAYMHGMVYIDLNHDGDFSDEGENVANSALAGSPNLATGIATFTAPTEPGDYLMRFKVDWASTDPAGSSNICENGGSITDVVLRVRNTANNITLNITGDVTRNVPMNDLPEDTYDVATLLGAAMPSYITFTPSSITTSTTDQTFPVTATQSLPFATDGTQYFMNMGGKYATTENTNSLQLAFLQIQNSYLWRFSGNAIDGIKLYNVGAGKYAKVSNSNNSVAEFVSEGDAPYFELSANSYSKGAVVGGFCLKLAGTTNCYLNDRDNKLSTWTDNRATSAYGSMFKFESVNSFILAKLTALTSMTNYVGSVQAEALETGHAFKTKLEKVKANPTVAGYNEVISQAANYKVAPVDGGYYRIVSAYSRFPEAKAVYNDGGTMKWKSYAAEDASMVLKFIKNGDKWKIYVPSADAYMDGNTGATTTEAASAADYTFTDLNNAVLNINDGAGSLHANGHGEGTGADGTLKNYDGGVGSASAWYVIRYGNEVSEDTLIAPYQTSVDTVYQTYATSDNVIVANPGVTVYKVTGVANEKANIVKAGTKVVPASTGVILSGERGKTFTMLRVTTDVASQYEGNKLLQGDGTAKTGDFVLAYREADTDAHFYKIGTLKIPTNRAYLPYSSVSSSVAALALNFGDDDELTAIESLPAQAESAQGQAFDLQGRRVSKLQKGIYIVGGKKVMVK